MKNEENVPTTDELVTLIKLLSEDGNFPPIKDILSCLSVAMKSDSEYAFSWYCNLKMSLIDGGADVAAAEHSARYFMYTLFGVYVKPDRPAEPTNQSK